MTETTLAFSREELESLIIGTHLYYEACETSNKWPSPVEGLHREKAWRLYQKLRKAYDKAREGEGGSMEAQA